MPAKEMVVEMVGRAVRSKRAQQSTWMPTSSYSRTTFQATKHPIRLQYYIKRSLKYLYSTRPRHT